MAIDPSIPQSRRTLLAAAVGGLAGLIGGALGQPAPAAAAVGDPLRLGKGAKVNNAGTAATKMKTSTSGIGLFVAQNGSGIGIQGLSAGGTAVAGDAYASAAYGVLGRSLGPQGTGSAIRADGNNNHGLVGRTTNVNRYGVVGENTAALGDGVRGTGGVGGTGVIGIAAGGNGVYGESADGYGVFGQTDTGQAGHFAGPVGIEEYVDIAEMTAPANPAANHARLFVRDNGGKTELCVIFPSGAIQVIKTEA